MRKKKVVALVEQSRFGLIEDVFSRDRSVAITQVAPPGPFFQPATVAIIIETSFLGIFSLPPAQVAAPVILVADSFDPADEERYLGEGFHDCIPFGSPARLFHAISRITVPTEPYARRLEVLLGSSLEILAAASEQELLERIADTASRLTATTAGAMVLGPEGGPFQVAACIEGGAPVKVEAFTRLPTDGIFASIMSTAGVIRLTEEDLLQHEAWHGLPEGHIPLSGLLALAVEGGDKGEKAFIMVTSPRSGYFTDEDESLMRRLADIASEGLRQVTMRNRSRETEEALQKAHDDLERRVAERTRELAEAVEALLVSEERYAHAIQGTSDGIWDWDIPSGEVYYSPRWKAMLGYSEEELEGNFDTWRELVHPEDLPAAEARLREYLRGDASGYQIEFRVRHKNGSYRWVMSKGTCFWDLEGIPYRVCGSHTDISERKKAEEALKESEALLRTVLETLPVGVVVLDRSGVVKQLNEMAKTILGAGVDAEGYSEIRRCRHDTGTVVEPMEWGETRALRGEPVLGEVVVIDCLDGMRKTIINSAVAIRDTAGTIVGAVAVLEDVTQQKLLEQQLLHAQKMDSVGLLAGGVAHDFNNLLTAMKGYGELALAGIDDRHFVESSITEVLLAAERAAELTKSLLAFSRKREMKLEQVSLNDVIMTIGKILTRIIGEDITLVANLSKKNLPILADSGQLEQVLVNLATNARDAMPGGGNLTISTTDVVLDKQAAKLNGLEKEGRYACITVSDTGNGIDEKNRSRIFEPFFTTKEVGKGTGLGLSLAYAIVRQHNGSINVKSSPGAGTSFMLFFPLMEEESRPEPKVYRSELRGGTETILVAEDEVLVRHYLVAILERAGYRVIPAEDGSEAIDKVRLHHGDLSLMICDVVMPKKGGGQVYQEVQEIAPDLRVLFTSGYNDDVVLQQGICEHGLDFMRKPYSQRELLEKVREMIDRRNVSAAGVSQSA